MSERKWTPGPWETERGDRRWRVSINGQNWEGLAKVVVRMEHDQTDREDGWANARLIAAAPELYEALRDVESLVVSYCGNGSDLHITVKKALASAEGRDQ